MLNNNYLTTIEANIIKQEDEELEAAEEEEGDMDSFSSSHNNSIHLHPQQHPSGAYFYAEFMDPIIGTYKKLHNISHSSSSSRLNNDESYENDDDDDDDDELDTYVNRNKGGRKQVKVGTTKRNARERNRVRFINNCFEVLREHIPFEIVHNEKKSRKLSKVETLKYAALYIRQLGELLDKSSSSSSQQKEEAVTEEELPRRENKRLKSSMSVNLTPKSTITENFDTISINNININIYDNRMNQGFQASTSHIGSGDYGYPYSPTTSTSSSMSSSSSSSSCNSFSYPSSVNFSPKMVDHNFESATTTSTATNYFYPISTSYQQQHHHHNHHQPMIGVGGNGQKMFNASTASFFNHGGHLNAGFLS